MPPAVNSHVNVRLSFWPTEKVSHHDDDDDFIDVVVAGVVVIAAAIVIAVVVVIIRTFISTSLTSSCVIG